VQVLLGNSAAKEAYRDADGKVCHRPIEGRRVTRVVIPDSYTLMEKVRTVIDQDGVWNHHSRGDNVRDSSPDWVEADDEMVAQIIAQELGCRVGRPKTWKADA